MNIQQFKALISECISELSSEMKNEEMALPDTMHPISYKIEKTEQMLADVENLFKTNKIVSIEAIQNTLEPYLTIDLAAKFARDMGDEGAAQVGFVFFKPLGVYASASDVQAVKSLFGGNKVGKTQLRRKIQDIFGAEYLPAEDSDEMEVLTDIADEYGYKATFPDDFGLVKFVPKSSSTPTIEPQLENIKSKLKKLITEEVKEIESKKKLAIAEMMSELEAEVKKSYKEAVLQKYTKDDFTLCNCQPHHFRIRHQYGEVFEVTHIADGSDRTKKFNLNFEQLKDFVKESLKEKQNYVEKAYNKAASQTKDVVEKVDFPKNDVLTKKEVKDVKKEDKDYNEAQVSKKEDMPDQKMKEIGNIKKQVDHPIKGEKVDYTPPKEVSKKHVVKGEVANRRFKGLPKTNK